MRESTKIVKPATMPPSFSHPNQNQGNQFNSYVSKATEDTEKAKNRISSLKQQIEVFDSS
jgi:hypothetical protein